MARKIKFALEMADGTKVRGDLAELREHFDLESAVRYFLSGKLVEWLDDRYYEDEADALEQIDKDAPDFHQKLCKALGVEYEAEDDLDVAVLERLNEKRSILRQRTDDEEIIKNADKTALTQEDLVDLLDMGEDLIYLCGEEFTIPSRVKNKKYVGVLGTPKVTIKAKSEDELTDKEILFENVILPWNKNNKSNASKSEQEAATQLEDLHLDKIKEIFWNSFPHYKGRTFPIWEVVTDSGKKKKIELNNTQKEIAINMVCHEKYAEADILFIRIKSDLSAGFAFTKNSFCYGGSVGNEIILYKDIDAISTDELRFGGFKLFCGETVFKVTEWAKPCKGLIGQDKKAEVLVKFLSVVKNLYGVKDEIDPRVWFLRNSHPVRVNSLFR